MLCAKLDKDSMKLDSKVLSLSYDLDGRYTSKSWSISYSGKGGNELDLDQSFDAIVMTVKEVHGLMQ